MFVAPYRTHYEAHEGYTVALDTVTGQTLIGVTDSRKNQQLEELHRKQPEKLRKVLGFMGVCQWEIKQAGALAEVRRILDKPAKPAPKRSQKAGAGAPAE